MREGTPSTIYLKDYQPLAFQVDSIELRVELDPTQTRISSRLAVRRRAGALANAPLKLDGKQMQLTRVSVDGFELRRSEYEVDDESLTLTSLPDSCVVEIDTLIDPQGNTALEGLYLSNGMFCTQCEAHGFRKITYYPDRPDVLSRFTTTLIADKADYPVLLANGNLDDSGELDGGKHWARWVDPHPKPAYLFAMVAGDLSRVADSFTTMNGRKVALEIFVEHENVDKCAHAMTSLQKSMAWDEQTYSREYDLDIYMIVAVSHFNMGAMENKGLNVFNSRYVLASPETATDMDFEGIESVIAHEYFHNWSGNRVTCRDWFQLSLKEGFTVFRDQQFSADMGSATVKRIDDVRVIRGHQFLEDSGPMAHPVQPDSYIEINNFYTVTVYNKGAEVVRMLHTLLGGSQFRQATDLYFARHDGQAATVENFVRCMEEVSGRDLAQFRRWYKQAGTPVLDVVTDYDEASDVFTLLVKQSCPATPGQGEKQPFHIPLTLGLIGAGGEPLTLQLEDEEQPGAVERTLELTEPVHSFKFKNLGGKPVPSLLRRFSAPVKLDVGHSETDLTFLLARDPDLFNRWEAAQQLAQQVIQRQLDSPDQTSISSGVIDAFGAVLIEADLDPAMVAQIFQLPGEATLAEQQREIDPEQIYSARHTLRETLAGEHRAQFLQRYLAMKTEQTYAFDADQNAARALKNSCLSYLMEQPDEQVVGLCMEQFRSSNNMTDSLAALAALVHCDLPERQIALAEFYQQWRHDPLVIDKWFSLQAQSALAGTLERVEALLDHADFSLTNPNRVRSLVGAFISGNLRQFHAADGGGYQFLADQVLALDGLNPQVAARMVNPLGRWRRYEPVRRELMKTQLQRIVGQQGLSKDVFEIVSKSL
ncbi:MAG: aminopeptidase N [Gammaproteobacteria bacterium]|nr:MAG: aminopeptidase N [Gammaproteobacteria bacterium]RLA11845.1 MAG: aminopeptidase N [Gammaproteobacteria bacterium]